MNPKFKKYILVLGFFSLFIGVFRFFIYSSFTEDTKYKEAFEDKYQIFSIEVPKSLSFSEEAVPLEDIEVFERMDRELLVNTYWQSQTLLMHKRANRWFPIIEPILRQQGVPADFKYLPLVETGFLQATSPAGAVGFWQFLPGTAIEYGLEVNNEIDERYNVYKSTIAACHFLKELRSKLGSWTMAAAAYNMGLSNASKQMQKQKASNFYDLVLNAETSRYIFRILAIKEIIEHPNKYGYYFRQKDLYNLIPTYTVQIDTPVKDFADFAIALNINYKILKNYNPWLRESFLTNKDKKAYYIEIPKEGFKSHSPYTPAPAGGLEDDTPKFEQQEHRE